MIEYRQPTSDLGFTAPLGNPLTTYTIRSGRQFLRRPLDAARDEPVWTQSINTPMATTFVAEDEAQGVDSSRLGSYAMRSSISVIWRVECLARALRSQDWHAGHRAATRRAANVEGLAPIRLLSNRNYQYSSSE